MATIIVSGTPGTGKSSVARKLAKKLGYRYINVKRLLQKYKLKEKYDSKRKSWVVDEKKLAKALEKLIKESKSGLVIDSHLSHFISPKLVDLCVITKCELKALERRLRRRGYSKNKIRENLDCEIFDICLNEAQEIGHKIRIIDTTKPFDARKFRLNKN
jgi:adenylate kinase